MSMTVGELNVLLKADPSTLISGMNAAESAGSKAANNMSQKWEQASQKFQAVGTKMSTFVSLPIAAMGVAAIKLASDMSETTNKVDVAFGDSAQVVKDWSETTIDKMGMAAQTAMDSAALYGDMATGMGMAKDEASTMAMGMTQLAGDLASFKNVQVEVAQTALAGVFTGETESLKQLGIVMTETNLKQFAMSQGITKNIQDMTQAEKINLRYAYILSVTGNAQGDFARTSDGVANQTRMAGERIKELGASMGNLLLPEVAKVLGGVNNLIKGFTDLPESQKKTIITIAGVVAAIGPAIKVFGVMQKGVAAVQSVMKAFSATGMIGQLFASAAAHTATATAATAATVATTAEGAAATGTSAQLSMFAGAGTTAAASTVGVGTASTAAIPPVTAFGTALTTALGIIGLVAAAGIALYAVFSNFDKASEDMQKIVESSNSVSTSVNESVAAYNKSTAEMSAQGTLAGQLTTRLSALSEASTGATWDQTEMASIVSQLNTMYPTLGLAIDSNTGKLNKNTQEINESVTAMQALSEQQANQKAYNKLMEEKNTLMVDQIELNAKINPQLTEQQTSVIKWLTSMSGGVSVMKLFNKETGEFIADQGVAMEASEANTAAQVGLDASIASASANMGEFTTAESSNTDAITTNTAAIQTKLAAGQTLTADELANAEILTASGAAFTETELAQMQTQTAAYDAAKEKYKQMMADRLATATNAFEQISLGEDLSTQDVIDNLNANADAVNDWTNNMNLLAGSGLDDGFLATLQEKGTDAALLVQNMVDEMNESGDPKFTELNAAWENSTKIGINGMGTLMAAPEATSLASGMISANATGVQTNLELKTAASNQITDTKIAMQGAIATSDFNSLGTSIVNNLRDGLKSAKESMLEVARGIASELKSALTIRGTISISQTGTRSMNIDVGWYAGGAVFTQPQVIGVGDVENGEVVMPVNTLFDRISASVSKALSAKQTESTRSVQIINKFYPQTMTTAQETRLIRLINHELGIT
jgi:hypothetical protein